MLILVIRKTADADQLVIGVTLIRYLNHRQGFLAGVI